MVLNISVEDIYENRKEIGAIEYLYILFIHCL